MRRLAIHCFFFLLIYNPLFAQQRMQGNNIDPIISSKSPMFADDVYINNQPIQDQRHLCICSTFNGWLYAAYHYYRSDNWLNLVIMKSIDNGKTWTKISDGWVGAPGDYIVKADLIACGNDTANLRLFYGAVEYHISSGGSYQVLVARFNCQTELFEGDILHEYTQKGIDIALSGDYMYPAENSNPYSVAAIYAYKILYPIIKDTVVLATSSNGGMSFDHKGGVTSSLNHIPKVAIAYGRSPQYSNGKYFMAWEELANASNNFGHIYSAHTEPDFNSPTTSPYLLDSDPSLNNKVGNPAIACQFSASDNDSSNLTEVVFCEQNIPAENRFDIAGFYNKTATVSNNFQTFSISSSQNNKLQPNICYNPFDSTFMMTYFDSTIQKLPYLTNNVNLQNPYNWNVSSTGYNDNANLSSPHPNIILAQSQQSGACSWVAERSGGNGEAMFDAASNYPVGINPSNYSLESFSLSAYPNPATDKIVLEFSLENPSDIMMILSNSLGQVLENRVWDECKKGENRRTIDLRSYPAGIYLVSLSAGSKIVSKKVIIN